ncbi:AMP-binding protein [Salibacterium aidingense]|uniref:AMP-binding protein n=1 Tax=Salibacterium aidingense TaxID=384933 RepID=UPI003BE75E7B
MEEPVWFPDRFFIQKTRLYQWMKELGFEDYDSFWHQSIEDISWFWSEAEKKLSIEWFHPYKQTVDITNGKAWPEWYRGGLINTAHNAVHKWAIQEKNKDKTALLWEGEDGSCRRFSFSELRWEVDQAADGLKNSGISKGDVITLYMPMIPETVIAMMAAAKIGAVFSPVFSGYRAEAVAARLKASQSKMIITADGYTRRGKQVNMKEEADQAAKKSSSTTSLIMVEHLQSQVNWNSQTDKTWKELTAPSFPSSDMEEMKSSDPLMLIYTSGTTGKPKGTVHTHSGFPVKAAFDAGIGMDVKNEDLLFWQTDMGWMMGPFLVYGALLNGAALFMYEGTPDYPDPSRIWKMIEKNNITHAGISPTLIRALMKYGNEYIPSRPFSSLRIIASTGEPWNPEPWKWLYESVGKKQVPIFNYSGGTEISGGILGNVLVKPICPATFNAALPGMAARVFNEQGTSVTDEVGELVITQPWVGMTKGFWKEPKRYKETFWSRWEDCWVHGDWAIKDKHGFWKITGRSDDILNIAGKRIGPAEFESVLVAHPEVQEAGVIGVPDSLKGEEAVCFVVLYPERDGRVELKEELIQWCADKIGKSFRPAFVHFVSALPKTRNAKVMRRAIKAAYLHKEAGDLSSLENPTSIEEIKTLRTGD